MENVLRNAVYHSPSGGTVTVQLRIHESRALLTIEDQGTGIADEQLDRIFEPFYRTNKAVENASTHGTGLGLAIAQRAILKNSGTIRASNADGGGLRIEIRLPI